MKRRNNINFTIKSNELISRSFQCLKDGELLDGVIEIIVREDSFDAVVFTFDENDSIVENGYGDPLMTIIKDVEIRLLPKKQVVIKEKYLDPKVLDLNLD